MEYLFEKNTEDEDIDYTTYILTYSDFEKITNKGSNSNIKIGSLNPEIEEWI